MARSAADIQADLDVVNTTIARILAGGVQEFQQGSSDRAAMLNLTELRKHREALLAELGRVRRGTRARFLQGRSI
jgi:hypothetical protein